MALFAGKGLRRGGLVGGGDVIKGELWEFKDTYHFLVSSLCSIFMVNDVNPQIVNSSCLHAFSPLSWTLTLWNPKPK